MSRSDILKSVRDNDERIIYARVIDRAELTLKSCGSHFSDFVDPYKAAALSDIIKKEYGKALNISVWGGYDGAERRMVGFFSEYDEPKSTNFPIDCVEISYNGKFSRELTHRDYLGSVLGLGINREKTGDIIIYGDRAYLFAEREVAAFVVSSLERVGHTKVNTKLLETYESKQKSGVEKHLTLSSLRLDVLLSAAFNMSRGKTAELIKGEKAFINWLACTNVSRSVAEGDTVTLRGSGRVILKQVQGTTKKDRIAVVIEIFK